MAKISGYDPDTVLDDADYLVGVDSITGKTKRFLGSVIRAGMATLGDITNAKARANHTGTQTAATISDFAAAVAALGSSGSAVTRAIVQTAHGFSVGDVLRYNGSAYVKAKAVLATAGDQSSQVMGIVAAVADANNFSLALGGVVSGLSGLTGGRVYYLDPSTAGALTATRPVANATVVKPVLLATSTTAGILSPQRGSVNVVSRPYARGGINFGFENQSDVAVAARDLQYIGRYTRKLRLSIPSWNDASGIANIRALVLLANSMGFETTYGVTAAGTGHDNTYYNGWKSQVITEAAWAAANGVDLFFIGNEEDWWVNQGGITGPSEATVEADVLAMAATLKGSYPDMKLAYSTAEGEFLNWDSVAQTDPNWQYLDEFGINMYNSDFPGTLAYAQTLGFGSKLFLSEWSYSDNYPTSGLSASAWRAAILARRQALQASGITGYFFTWDWGGSYGTNDDWGFVNGDGTYKPGIEEVFGVPK